MRWIALLLLALAGCERPPPPARVALVGIDGASWDNLDPLIARGLMPRLARLRAEGATAPLTIDSAQSPESWTSIATGHHPPEHGILQTPGVEGSTFAATADQLRVRRVWDMASAQGRRVMVANYWVTGKVYPIHGVMIGRESDEVYPPGLLTQRPDLQPEAHGALIQRLYLGAAKTGWMQAALETVPDFDLIILPIYAYDQALHMLWDEWEAGEALAAGDPALQALPETERARVASGHGVVVETAKLADRLVGMAMDYVGEDGYVLVFSDHGHRAAEPSMRRVALSRAVLDGRPGTAEQGRFPVEGATLRLDPVERRVQGPTPALSYVLRLPELRIEGPEAEAWRARLLALTTASGEPLLVARGEVLTPGPAVLAASATALGQLVEPGFSVFVNSGAHGIEDKGIFGVLGPGVAGGALQVEVESVDITPTALWLMGLPTAEDLAGAPVTAVLGPDGGGRPVRTVATYEDGVRPGASAGPAGMSVEEVERLKALGYLSGGAAPPEGAQGPATPPPRREPPPGP